MTQKKLETDDLGHSARLSPEDYAIYPHRDHVTQEAIPFILDDYGDVGVFCEQQISDLSERHNLSKEELRELV